MLCVSLKTIGDGILLFIEDMRSKIANHVLNSGSLQTDLQHQCEVDEKKQEWLANSLIDFVVQEARRQQLKFAHCYLFDKSVNTNAGTVRVAIIHGVERKSTFLSSKIDDMEDNDFVSATRPRLNKGDHPETYMYVPQSNEFTYTVIGGMMTNVQLPSDGKSKSRRTLLPIISTTHV